MLHGKDDDGHTLSLYRKSDMKLYAEYNGSEISTGLTLSSNCWHTVGLSFDVVIIPSLNPFPPNMGGQITIQPPNEAHLTIFVDDACYSKTILTEVSALQNMKFSIGRMFDESVTSTSFGDIKESYPLYGQIEMVAASSELCTSATLLQLEDDLNCMSKTNEYDDLGMLKNTYIYDEQGLRTRKIAPDGSVTKYLYNGTKLAAEIAPNYRLDFLYDENDMLYGFVKDGSAKYFYARDMLQNILGIIDTNGSPVVIYQYTAYGTSTVLQDTAGLASINPFRFKGYYFDSESGMYYCHTRYYVPEWCRWLNADHPSFLQPESLQEMNLFMYCGNNPVMYTDPSGAIVISLLVGLAVSFAVGFISSTIAHVR